MCLFASQSNVHSSTALHLPPTLHCTTVHYSTLHYNTLQYITVQYITLLYITSHYTTLHYTILHYQYLRGHNFCQYCTKNIVTSHCCKQIVFIFCLLSFPEGQLQHLVGELPLVVKSHGFYRQILNIASNQDSSGRCTYIHPGMKSIAAAPPPSRSAHLRLWLRLRLLPTVIDSTVPSGCWMIVDFG